MPIKKTLTPKPEYIAPLSITAIQTQKMASVLLQPLKDKPINPMAGPR